MESCGGLKDTPLSVAGSYTKSHALKPLLKNIMKTVTVLYLNISTIMRRR